MGIPRKSGGRVPLSLAVKMLWRYRSKGNKWQENKSQGVEFCDSAGETAYCSLQYACHLGCQDMIMEYEPSMDNDPKRGKKRRIQSRAKTALSPGHQWLKFQKDPGGVGLGVIITIITVIITVSNCAVFTYISHLICNSPTHMK